ncbi:MAG: hypothetical protein JWN60_2929 [Acidobacteria bacterium]|jgi:hypothetical protein|nr:hypothetical protein [Acidobacteriota bacterium]
MADEENNKKKENSASYTKAGLMGRSDDSEKEPGDETERQKNASDESTPKISKNEATHHNNDKPLH